MRPDEGPGEQELQMSKGCPAAGGEDASKTNSGVWPIVRDDQRKQDCVVCYLGYTTQSLSLWIYQDIISTTTTPKFKKGVVFLLAIRHM